jgi:aminoglycoside phosphotransferase
MNDRLTPRDAAVRAADYLGHALHLIGRYDLGAEGAYQVTVRDTPCVFKYWSGDQATELRLSSAVAAHKILHQYGWPLPDIHFWHSDQHFAFVVEAQMCGHRVEAVPEALCHQLLALLAAVPRGAGGINADTRAWLESLAQSLHYDLPLSPCRPIVLQRTPIGRRMVARAREAFTTAHADLAAARDVIHGDFSAGNILCDDAGSLAAMLDWQHGGIGHRGFDLIGLEWDLALRLNVGSAPSLALVTARVNQLIEEPVRAFCRAYYGIWNLSWALDTPFEQEVLRAADVVGIV